MSDDNFSFFDDPVDNSPEPVADPAPTADPAPSPAPESSVTPEQFADLQRKLDATEKWKQDMGRMFLGQTGQQLPEQADPNAVLQQMLADPIKFQQQTVNTAVQQAQIQMQNEAIIADRRAKYPEIAKLENFIDWDSAGTKASQEFRVKHGREPNFAEALDASIALIQSQLQGIPNGNQGNPQADAAKRMTLNLDLGGGQSTSNPPLDPSKISDADWPKYRDELLHRSQGF